MTASISSMCTRCQERPASRRGLCTACYALRRKRDIAYGRWESGHIDATPAQRRVEELRAAGLGRRRIAELSGLPTRTVFEIYRRQRTFIRKETAEAILAIKPPASPLELAADGAFISGVGSTRRLRALIADGYTSRQIAAAIGCYPRSLSGLIVGSQHIVTARKARAIADAFNHLQLIPGTSSRSRLRAQRNGWAPPLAWDEDAIDDPKATPAAATGQSSFVDRYRDARATGRNPDQIAQLLGIKPKSLERQLSRNGIYREVS